MVLDYVMRCGKLLSDWFGSTCNFY